MNYASTQVTKNSSAIINVALLDTFKSTTKHDYVECFLPVLAKILSSMDKDKIIIEDVCESFFDELKIRFPLSSVNAILVRAVKRGLLKKSEGSYFKEKSEIDNYLAKYNKNKVKIIESQDILAKEFIRFSFDKFEKSYSEDEFFDHFYTYLKNNLLDILGPKFTPDVQGKSPGNINFLISSFLKSCWVQGTGFPEMIEHNIQGFLLSNYISTAAIGLAERIKCFKLYIDTPIVIAALGYNGKSKEAYSTEFLSSLKEAGADIRLLSVNYEELKGIIRGWANDLRLNRYERFKSHTLRLFKNREIDDVVLERHLTLLDSTLSKLGVTIYDKPEYVEAIQLDEVGLKADLVKDGFDPDRHATDRDVDCLSAINILRKGKKTSTRDNDIYIFLTNNPSLRRISNDFFIKEGLLDEESVPPALGEAVMASLLLANHSGKFADIGKKLLLSQAYSSIFTDDNFLEKFSKRLDNLKNEGSITTDEYVVYRYDHEVRSFINSYRVKNDLDELRDTDFFDILEKIKEKEKYKEKQQRDEQDKELAYYREAMKKEANRAENLKSAHEEVKEKNRHLIDKHNELDSKHERLRKFIRIIVGICTFLIIGLITYLFTRISDTDFGSKYSSAVWSFGFIVSLFVGYFGLSGNQVSKLILDYIEKNN